MAQEQDSNILDFLERSGFEKTSRPGWVNWIFSGPKLVGSDKNVKKSRNKKDIEQEPLWKVDRLEITERKGNYNLSSFNLALDYARFKENVARAARKFYGARTTATIVDCGRGSFWVHLEFVKSAAKKNQVRQQASDYLPYGVAGFKVGLGSSGESIEVYFSEFFGIGFVPQSFATSHVRILFEALNLRKLSDRFPALVSNKSLFEFHVSPALVLALVSPDGDFPKELHSDRSRQVNLAVQSKDGRIMFQLGAGEAVFELSQGSSAPVVVLESRERSDTMGGVDELLLAGKMSKACRAIIDVTRAGTSAPYFLRRLCLLSVCGHEIQDDVINAHFVESPVEKKLYLSHKVRTAALTGNMGQILDHLSQLGKLLVTDVPDIESVKSFDLVVPELLGDAWCSINSKKAEACYERVLQRCGDLPRILRKMITITKVDSDHAREFFLLSRLSMVERRRNELARIFVRLAELSKTHRELKGDPLEFAFKSLQNDRNHYQSALLAAELLNDAEKPNEAIALLDQMLGDVSVNIPQKARAKLEYAIGLSWQQKLSRPDLAERRFERAVAQDDTHIESLSKLEAIYRATGQSQKIGGLLERQFDAYERSGDLENLKRVFEELVELFRGPMGEPKKAYELYQRMLALAIVEPEEIDKLMAWRDIEIDWRSIYRKLVENLKNLPDGTVSARYHLRLAEICRDKLNDPGGTFDHYLAALNHGGIDNNGFRMIVERLASDQDYDRLADCFETRLSQIKGKDRVELIIEIMSFPGVLSDPRRDQLSVEAFVTDESKSAILFQRLKFYQSMDDVDGLERFAGVISDLVKAPSKVCSWIRNVIETLQECVDPTKFRAIDKLYRRIYEIDADSAAVLVEAINLFKATMDAGRCSFYVRELLNIDEIPDLSSKLVARYLVGFDADLAKYHYLKAVVAKRPEDIRSDARVANTIYKKLPGHHKMQEKSLHLLGMSESLTDVDLKDLHSLAGITENWIDAVKVLQKQADLTADPVKKGQLLLDQGHMLWKDMRDTGRARLAYVMAMNFVAKKAPIKMLLAQLAEESGQKEQELRALVDYIIDDESAADHAAYQKVVSRMLTLGKEPYSVYKLVKARLTQIAGEDDSAVVLKISEILIAAGLLNQDLFLLSFRCAVNGRFIDDAIDYWWRGLRSVQNRSGIKTYLSETLALLQSAEREDLMLKCYRAAIQNGVTDELPEKVRQEVLVQYGLILFDSDLRRGKALPVFKEAYKTDPTDNRTWLPIYFILEEQGDLTQQYLFLKEMIVRLREDARPLRQYPITIESLEMQLNELAGQAEGVGQEDQFIDPSDSNELGAEHTTVSKLHTVDAGLMERLAREESGNNETSVNIGVDSDNVEEIPVSMVSGDSVANMELPDAQAPHLALAGSIPDGPESTQSGSPVARAGSSEKPDMYVGKAESSLVPGFVPSDLGLDLSRGVGSDDAPEPEAVDQVSGDGVQMLDLGFGADEGLIPKDMDMPDSNLVPSMNLTDLGGGITGFSLDDLPKPTAADGSQFAGEDVSLVIDFNESADPGGGFVPPVQMDIESASPVMGDFNLSVDVPDIDFSTPGVPVSDSGMAGFDFSLESVDQESISSAGAGSMLAEVPPPPGMSHSAHSIPLPDIPDEASIPPPPVHSSEGDAGAAEEEPKQSEKLSLNLNVPDFKMSDEVSSVELAAALDIKGMLSEEEYSSPSLLTANSLLHDVGSSKSLTGIPLPPGSEDSIQGSIHKVSAGLDDAHPNSLGAADWRGGVLTGDVTADLTERLMRQAFANEVEKHLALQCIALISGNCHLLNSWHWRVWRNSREYGYQLSGRERFNAEFTSPALQSTLHQFVIACNPLMAKVFRERYTIEHLARILGVSAQAIEKAKKQVSWQQGILNDVGFHLYTDRIEKRGYKAFNLPGLGSNIFFEGPKKTVYFDEVYFTKQPPGALFHRILSLLWSIRLQYYIPLALDPKKQVLPFLNELHQKLEVQGISKLAEKIKSRSPLAKHLATMDIRNLQTLKAKTGVPSEAQVSALWFAMQEHIFKLILSETLDVIGLFEAILGRDLAKSNSLKQGEILTMSPYSQPLLEFATKLVL